jgi:hypothetical protein
MNTITSPTMIKGASIFLLTIPPIEELPEELVDVVSRVRAGTLSKCEGLAYMEQTKNKFISNWITENKRLNDELEG